MSMPSLTNVSLRSRAVPARALRACLSNSSRFSSKATLHFSAASCERSAVFSLRNESITSCCRRNIPMSRLVGTRSSAIVISLPHLDQVDRAEHEGHHTATHEKTGEPPHHRCSYRNHNTSQQQGSPGQLFIIHPSTPTIPIMDRASMKEGPTLLSTG